MQPIAVDDRRVGTLSSHDDGGTSTAETAASLAADVGADVALALVETVARAAFARGNHRVAWSVRDDDALLIGALTAPTRPASWTEPFVALTRPRPHRAR